MHSTAALESRTLLAGNVTAAIVDGELIITGDAPPNDITRFSKQLRVSSRRGNSTTINGGRPILSRLPVSRTNGQDCGHYGGRK